MNRDTYRFAGQEVFYNLFRPNWSPAFAIQSLRGAGIYKDTDGAWIGTVNGNPPIIISIGAGTGADAAEFKKLGCHVILVEPNGALLSIAKANMAKITEGSAEFHTGNALDTKIPEGTKADLIVVAQAVHTLKNTFSEQYMTEEQKSGGKGAEELARAHLATFLPDDDNRNRFSVWYYNPRPEEEMTHELHRLLLENCPNYAKSKTPLLNAEYFDPKHFQPWMSAE